MGMIHIFERGGDDEYRFKKALKMAKDAIDDICELSDKMEDQYSERMSRRSMSRRDDWDDMDERRGSYHRMGR